MAAAEVEQQQGDTMKHIPRKRFGQNFLTDQAVLHDIIRVIAPQPDDAMVEIGPGLAAMTRLLLERLRELHVVELDRDLVARLQQDLRPEAPACACRRRAAIRLRHAGAAGRQAAGGRQPAVQHLQPAAVSPCRASRRWSQDQHFMLQKEVVERMVARAGQQGLWPAVGDAAVALSHGPAVHRAARPPSIRRRRWTRPSCG